MDFSIKEKFSKVAKDSGRSFIREILKLLTNPNIISFAGGLPSPASFPIEDIRRITSKILKECGEYTLQYGTTEGDVLLREELAKYLNKQDYNTCFENILITIGSQQALDIIAKQFIEKDDNILVGLPSYLGALNVFSSYYPKTIGIELDDKGMRADLLEQKLDNIYKGGEIVKLIYLIPDFQNPTGITMPLKRREQILRIAQKYGVLILEDSPYRLVRFFGENIPTLFSLAGGKGVINLGTFSKILAPGFRLGWITAQSEIIKKAVSLKQTMDLCTPLFTQKVAGEYMRSGCFEANLPKIKKIYKEKLCTMIECFKKYMPDEVSWVEPEGGLFLFVTLPSHIDTMELLHLCTKEYDIAFVPGVVFYCDGSVKNKLRVNFSYSSIEQITLGVQRLAQAIKKML